MSNISKALREKNLFLHAAFVNLSLQKYNSMTGMNIMFLAKKLLPLKSLWTTAQTPARNVV